MTLKENPKYAIYKVYSNMGDKSKEKEDNLVETPVMHKLFETYGIYNFGKLDLTRFGWKRIQPTSDEEEMVGLVGKNGSREDDKISNSKRYHAQKNLVYSSDKAIIIIDVNRETEYHLIDINLRNYSNLNTQVIEETKRMLEGMLQCKLKERAPNKDLNLIGIIEEN